MLFADILREVEDQELPPEECKKKFLRRYREYAQGGDRWRASRDPNYAAYRRQIGVAQAGLAALRRARRRESQDIASGMFRVGAWSFELPPSYALWLPLSVIAVLAYVVGFSHVFLNLCGSLIGYCMLTGSVEFVRRIAMHRRYKKRVLGLLRDVDERGDKLLPIAQDAQVFLPPHRP